MKREYCNNKKLTTQKKKEAGIEEAERFNERDLPFFEM